MLFLVSRGPTPDSRVWPGRRLLAAMDALLWPSVCAGLLLTSSFPTGAVGLLGAGVAILLAIRRLWTALLANHRYVFTTLRWGRPLLAVLLIGVAMGALLSRMPLSTQLTFP